MEARVGCARKYPFQPRHIVSTLTQLNSTLSGLGFLLPYIPGLHPGLFVFNPFRIGVALLKARRKSFDPFDAVSPTLGIYTTSLPFYLFTFYSFYLFTFYPFTSLPFYLFTSLPFYLFTPFTFLPLYLFTFTLHPFTHMPDDIGQVGSIEPCEFRIFFKPRKLAFGVSPRIPF